MTSYADNFQSYVKEHGIGSSDTFKFKEGKNRLRILTEPKPHVSVYKGTPSTKWVCYLTENATVQLAFLPTTIASQIAMFQRDEDYAFDTFPMPYDITVTAVNAGTIEVKYTVIPSPKQTSVTATELETLAKKTPIEKVLATLRQKQGTAVAVKPEEQEDGEEIRVEDIDFTA